MKDGWEVCFRFVEKNHGTDGYLQTRKDSRSFGSLVCAIELRKKTAKIRGSSLKKWKPRLCLQRSPLGEGSLAGFGRGSGYTPEN